MRTRWERRSQWFNRTFKPICRHPAEKLVTRDYGGQREIRCLKCGEVTARQMKP
jgi:hypothetical protein